jgi:SagB-type dehydrogenase family enzyme
LCASPAKKAQPPTKIVARLRRNVALEAHASGEIVAYSAGDSIALGKFGAEVTDRLTDLRAGLPLASITANRRKADKELELFIRRLAGRGLLEFYLRASRKSPVPIVIEPQIADYWPSAIQLRDADVLVLSRFAYMRRRDHEFVVESPRAAALFRISDPKVAASLALLSTPQPIKQLRRSDNFPGADILGLLLDGHILFKVDPKVGYDLRPAEGDEHLILWDFHDLLFHTRSTQGRHAYPIGGIYPHVGAIPPLPTERPGWPGKKINLPTVMSQTAAAPEIAKLLQERHSVRSFDASKPITLAELAQFLAHTARTLETGPYQAENDDGGHRVRPYPSAGASYELEIYLAVDRCDGLARGFYHYESESHALVPIHVGQRDFGALFMGAQQAMGVLDVPQILITIAARFGRVSWKYSSIAYSLILKNAGVLTQSFYLVATAMGLGGCAIGITDIELFRRMTGLDVHAEGPVGQFALGRPATLARKTD